LTFRLKAAPEWRLDLSPLTPDRLAAVASRDVPRIAILGGNKTTPAGDLFEIAPGDPSDIRILDSCDKLDFIGRDMRSGGITVDGNAGAYCGLNLAGGELTVNGNVGDYAAAGMSAGRLKVAGDAGDHLGGALPGEMRGMNGGTTVVHGRAGQRLGDRMRRGTIIVEGDIGAYAASRMIAGTIIALGSGVGSYPGFGMKRGTLILRGDAERELPTFGDCGRHELPFLNLLLLQLRDISGRLDQFAAQSKFVHRRVGDQAAGGKGEILYWRN
jgi:formylmethanofuran dehydrogenase subunit C